MKITIYWISGCFDNGAANKIIEYILFPIRIYTVPHKKHTNTLFKNLL